MLTFSHAILEMLVSHGVCRFRFEFGSSRHGHANIWPSCLVQGWHFYTGSCSSIGIMGLDGGDGPNSNLDRQTLVSRAAIGAEKVTFFAWHQVCWDLGYHGILLDVAQGQGHSCSSDVMTKNNPILLSEYLQNNWTQFHVESWYSSYKFKYLLYFMQVRIPDSCYYIV